MRRIPSPATRAASTTTSATAPRRCSPGRAAARTCTSLRRVTTPPAPGDITPSWIRDQILSVLDLGSRLPAHEAAYFGRVLVHLTSCDARREDQWEKTPGGTSSAPSG
ncbi:hypothetical protein ACFQ3Z_01855 [Streptomyces nogalater]